MLGFNLRDEFKGERLKGTTIDFSADKPTSALKKSAAEFLSITYPSIDLLRMFEVTQPEKSRPVVLLSQLIVKISWSPVTLPVPVS